MARPKKDETVEKNEELQADLMEGKEEPKKEAGDEEVKEDDKKVEPEGQPLGDSPTTVDTLPVEAGVETDEGLVRPDFARLAASRAVFDTSGTAGEADHDLRRTAATWDSEIKKIEDVPEYLQKHLDGSQSHDAIMEQAYRP